MIRQLFHHLKKYHEANLWLEKARIREEKKRWYETPIYPVSVSNDVPNIPHPLVVFSRKDIGHNAEERNRIQELYQELSEVPLLSRIALG